MYDPTTYKFYDQEKPMENPSIENGGVLYRLCSPAYCDKDFVLNSLASVRFKREGRFNRPFQPATYVATTALIAVSEILSHMHNSLITSLQMNICPRQISADYMAKQMKLMVITIQEMPNLIHAESASAVRLDSRMRGTAVVCPLHNYLPLQEFGDRVRSDPSNYKGIVYPSARRTCGDHGAACVLFWDETTLVKSVETLDVKIALAGEKSVKDGFWKEADPYSEKVHPTVGYYEFVEPAKFDIAKRSGAISPELGDYQGFVNFLRP